MQSVLKSATLSPKRGVPLAVQCVGVYHHFGEGDARTPALVDVSLEIGRGEVVILTGPSGSGKTTLLTLIGGLRAVQDGSLRVLGRELHGQGAAELVALRRKIGFIFQNHNLFSSLSAIENVRMATALREQSTREANERAVRMLDRLGLAARLGYKPAKLSGGQRQRVAIARALVNGPELVLADEPTASLDAASGNEVLSLLRELSDGELRATVLIVTHDERVLQRADRIVNLVGGRIVSNVRPEVSIRIVELLRKIPAFDRASVAMLTRAADQMVVAMHAPGDLIVKEGGMGDRWFMIGSGQAEATRAGRATRLLGPGDFFGELSVLSGQPNPETVRAQTELELFVMTADALDRLMAEEPALDHYVRHELMSRQ